MKAESSTDDQVLYKLDRVRIRGKMDEGTQSFLVLPSCVTYIKVCQWRMNYFELYVFIFAGVFPIQVNIPSAFRMS